MEMPAELKPALMGAIGGAIALAIVGFNWGGWVTGATADTMSKQSASKAVVAALAPICAENFRRSPDATAQLLELKKVSSWQQSTFVEKGGWAKMPGTSTIESGLTGACADLLVAVAKP